MLQPPISPTALAEKLVAELRASADPANLEGMRRYGISAEGTLGASMPVVRGLARNATRLLGRDAQARHETAAALWDSGIHEARVMASIVDVPSLVGETQMESWAAQLDSWDMCDQLCINLLRKTDAAWAKATEWPLRQEEFVRRAGFALGATLAVHDKTSPDSRFVPLLALARAAATDDRNLVKKAVNWQLRQIGKRSAPLNADAIATCEQMLAEHPESRSARFIARDALRELGSDAVRARLGLG